MESAPALAPALAPAPNPTPASASRRDLRIDLFRGLALVFIFLDHIPNNSFGNWTPRNWGFSDAAEMFVFFSGFSTGRAYGGVLHRLGWGAAIKRIWRRCLDIYLAHVLLLAMLSIAVVWAAGSTHRQAFLDDMRISPLFWDTGRALVQTLLLKFRPVNTDVLPLYVVLMAVFPAVLWGLERVPRLVLLLSALLYAAANWLGWEFLTYPHREPWLFNPLAWQALFVFGAFLGNRAEPLMISARWRRVLVPVAVVYVLIALYLAQSWVHPSLAWVVPDWLGPKIYPISKTNLAPLRLIHFAALVYLGALVVPRQAEWIKSWWAEPFLRCGQHSLPVFCLGVFMSFVGYFFLVMVSGSMFAQVIVSLGGISILCTAANGLHERKQKQVAARQAARG